MTLPTFSENLHLSENFQLSVYLIAVYILLQKVHRIKTATVLFMPMSTDSSTTLDMNLDEFEKWPQFLWSNKLCEWVKIWESNFRIFTISFGNQKSNSENYIFSLFLLGLHIISSAEEKAGFKQHCHFHPRGNCFGANLSLQPTRILWLFIFARNLFLNNPSNLHFYKLHVHSTIQICIYTKLN